MSNDKYDDDEGFFNLSEAKWVNRITSESLVYGEDWENPEKRNVTAKLMLEVSSTIEIQETRRTKAKVFSIERNEEKTR